MVRHATSVFAAFFLLLAGAPAAAQPVKCVDAKGKVRYLDASAMGQEKCEPVKSAVNVVTPQPGTARPAKPAPSGAPADARLAKAEAALAQAKKRLEEQEAIRSGSERNYARVQERLKPYQDAVEKAQRDLDSARRAAR